jgi:hypothetical protein
VELINTITILDISVDNWMWPQYSLAYNCDFRRLLFPLWTVHLSTGKMLSKETMTTSTKVDPKAKERLVNIWLIKKKIFFITNWNKRL